MIAAVPYATTSVIVCPISEESKRIITTALAPIARAFSTMRSIACRRVSSTNRITAGICDIGLMMTRDRVGRRPEDEHAQVLLDVVEAVLDSGPDEHQTAGLHRSILIRNSNDAVPADHVVHLVLAMRLLMIRGPGRPHRETNAQPFRREEIDVAMTLCIPGLRVEVRNLVPLHCRFSATTILHISTLLGGTAWLR